MMASKKPVDMQQLFSQAGQSQQVLQLKDRVEELEDELRQLRTNSVSTDEKEELEQQIQELSNQLFKQGGEHQIAIQLIQPDPDQPRTIFPDALIQERAKSLREEGQQSPIIVIPQEGWYKLFDGELRWRSAQLIGMQTLRVVYLTQEALDSLDKADIFDRQLTTSIQSEKLHPLDLANGLIKLMIYRYPDLQEQAGEIPSLLNAAIQRMKRNQKVRELDAIRIADSATQQDWLDGAGFASVEEQWIFAVILGKQLNPVSINSNVFPLLQLPPDLQNAVRTEGLESSKVLELKKLSARQLDADEDTALKIRAEVTRQAVQERLSLSQIRTLVNQKMGQHNPTLQKRSSQKDAVIQTVDSIPVRRLDHAQLVLLRQVLRNKLEEVETLIGS